MGIRFKCPNGHTLHVKADLAGQRGICPECSARVEIPNLLPEKQAGAEQPQEPQPKMRQPQKPQPDPAPAKPPKAIPRAKPVRAVAKPAAEPAAPAPADSQPPPPPPSRIPPSPPSGTPAVAWHVRTASGEQLGPGDTTALQRWAADGKVTQADFVWREGWENWRVVSEVGSDLPVDLPIQAPPKVEVTESKPSAAKRYVEQRKRSAARQKYVAAFLLLLVVGTGTAMAIVLRSLDDNGGQSNEVDTQDPPGVEQQAGQKESKPKEGKPKEEPAGDDPPKPGKMSGDPPAEGPMNDGLMNDGPALELPAMDDPFDE